MTKNRHLFLTIPLCFILLFHAEASSPEPTSALEYQQISNTRIVVEENFLRFFTGGSERITIDGDGKVGIGTTSPSNKLTVKSTGVGQDGFNIVNSSNNEFFEIGTLSDNESYLQVNDKDGNVGLQYRTDNHMFQLNDLRITESYSIATETAWIHYKTAHDRQLGLLLTNDSKTKAEIKLWEGNTHNPYISFSTALNYESNMEERMRIDKYGNVGISTINPEAKLEIFNNDPAGTPTLIVNNTWKSHSIHADQNSPFVIRRNNSNNESISAFVQDHVTHYYYKNDENSGAIQFRIENTDTESNGGANSNINTPLYLHSSQSGVKVGINTTQPAHTLHVAGNTHSSTYSADSPPTWPDYVFEDSYELTEIEAVEKYIEKNHHLPEIPSAAEVKENGVDLVDMQAKLLQKIEELTLYVIEQNKQLQAQNQKIELQQKAIEKLKSKL